MKRIVIISGVIVTSLIVTILLFGGWLNNGHNNEHYDGIFEIGFKNFLNMTLVNITITDLSNNTTAFSTDLFVGGMSYNSTKIPLPTGKYRIFIKTSHNLKIDFSIIITDNTPNNVYLLAIYEDKIVIAGFPKT